MGTSPRRSACDPLRQHVADDDVVAEVGEAGARDEPDVARAEDGDPAHYLTRASGLRPLAIASMVSFESLFESVLTTQ